MSEFLSPDEIAELTGKKRPTAQIAWLASKGWIYETNAAGRPIVSREHAREKLGGYQHRQNVGRLPDFGALV